MDREGDQKQNASGCNRWLVHEQDVSIHELMCVHIGMHKKARTTNRWLSGTIDGSRRIDDPTRIHTLRKYLGQAEDKTSVETVRAKQ